MRAKRKKYSLERRRKIGEGISRSYREKWEANPFRPSDKLCAKCGETKEITAFGVVKRKLKSGITTERPTSWCKECCRKAEKARRVRREAEGIDVKKLKVASDRRWRAGLSVQKREALRERMREAQTATRRKKGARPVKPRTPAAGNQAYVATEPLASFLEKEVENRSFQSVSEAAGTSQRRLSSILKREYETVSLRVADQFLSGLGVPHELYLLYPEA